MNNNKHESFYTTIFLNFPPRALILLHDILLFALLLLLNY